MKHGIYGYVNQETGEVVYIGKDNRIDTNKRHTEHISPSHFERQEINQKIKSEDLGYVVLAECINEEVMNFMESKFIEYFSPIYNNRQGFKHE